MRLCLMTAMILTAAPVLAAEKPAKAPKEKLICRVSQATGTRFAPPAVCKTAAQWQADHDKLQAEMDQRGREGRDH